MSVVIKDPKLDQQKQQRIEIATRLMEAWIAGGMSNHLHIKEQAKEFVKVAELIQQEA